MKKFIKSPKMRRFAALFFALLLVASNLCFAAADGEEGTGDIASEITAKFNNFYTVIYSILKVVAIGMMIWAIVQFVIAQQTHDQSQKLTSLLMIAFAVVLFFTEQIVGIFM